ncbi:hypothetical protein SAMN05518848_1241 [Paenibacillus sp. PDC88]|nr:hypothetical protein SAMN05518848_1241 [Paenibacillus sp. PDC88]
MEGVGQAMFKLIRELVVVKKASNKTKKSSGMMSSPRFE